ncbi:phosphatidylglycerol--membrane-oligosaccharide glycerophosphotransferase [Candidatus Pantoea multigeneris]|uniref:Phosphatidylglycerol--membrane-oligosaccharide glycerophosphotransferase n=1 Tax=Candidatus Pantoea multigeneris TaxID=2608357 RepID=A0ABX0RE02_9GAMM|nr:phosphatidylglycerol--membrane-oligosaccharide glycerophosphotransferase [Pantoea multigeneris]NIF22541.1 phosphatidylglycerol--membrane-oligosaccharide glycerophosphotransferase [Pantoea multigeneris]
MSESISVALFLAAIAVYSYKAGNHRFWFVLVITLLILFILLNATLLASNYFTGSGITDAVVYTLTNSLTGAGVSKYVVPALGLILGLGSLCYLLSWLLRRRDRPHHLGWSLLAVACAAGSVQTTPAFRQVSGLIAAHTQAADSDFEDYFKVPNKSIPQPKLNVVYIYGESLERTYFNQQAFPDLAPELSREKDQSLDFSETEQLPGTDYTIAGMVASQCGIPLFAPFNGNASAALSSFYPQNICLGDILKNSGYENWFIQGADLRFAGKDVFLRSHGFDPSHMYGSQELQSRVVDPNYRNNWGYYDDTVMDEVYEKFAELSRENKRFALFTLTVDTHHPDGFISRSCQRKSYSYDGKPNQSFSAVACSQEHVARLIERIKASPYFKNTVIVVGSDHLAMNNTAYPYLLKQPRRDLFMVIRGDRPEAKIIEGKRSTLDNGATLLDILGGDNFIGLGRSSLSSASLSSTFDDMTQKVTAWKADIIQLWNFPKKLDTFTLDQQKNTFSFSGSTFKMPILFRITDQHVEPLPEGEYAAPLRYQISDFAAGEKFVWVDRCYKVARLWQPDLALSTDLCMAVGQMGGKPSVTRVDQPIWKGKIHWPDSTLSVNQYEENVANARIKENDIRYPANSFIFAIPGAPASVKQFSGISRQENWGRWSNANLAPKVTIEYNDPLPANFELVITARAFGDNIGKPIPVQIGNQVQNLVLSEAFSTTTLRFNNPGTSHTLTITPPDPQFSDLDNIIGQAPRKLGIGMREIKIVPQE